MTPSRARDHGRGEGRMGRAKWPRCTLQIHKGVRSCVINVKHHALFSFIFVVAVPFTSIKFLSFSYPSHHHQPLITSNTYVAFFIHYDTGASR